jgi:hypothetical protein
MMKKIEIMESQKSFDFLKINYPLYKNNINEGTKNFKKEIDKFYNPYFRQNDNIEILNYDAENSIIEIDDIYFKKGDIIGFNNKTYIVSKIIENDLKNNKQKMQIKNIKDIVSNRRKQDFSNFKYLKKYILNNMNGYFIFDYFNFPFYFSEISLKLKYENLTINESDNGVLAFKENMDFIDKKDIGKKYIFVIEYYDRDIKSFDMNNIDEKQCHFENRKILDFIDIKHIDGRTIFNINDVINETNQIKIIYLPDLTYKINNNIEIKPKINFNIEKETIDFEINRAFYKIEFFDANKNIDKIYLKNLMFDEIESKFLNNDILNDESCILFFPFNGSNVSTDLKYRFIGKRTDYKVGNNCKVPYYYECMNNTEDILALDTLTETEYKSDLNLNLNNSFSFTFFMNHSNFKNNFQSNRHFLTFDFENNSLLFERRKQEDLLYFVLTNKDRKSLKITKIDISELSKFNNKWNFYTLKTDDTNKKIILTIENLEDSVDIILDVEKLNLDFGNLKRIFINEHSFINKGLNLKIKNLRIFNKELSLEEKAQIKLELDFLLKRKQLKALTDIYVDLKIDEKNIIKNGVSNKRLQIVSNYQNYQYQLEKGKNLSTDDVCHLKAYYNKFIGNSLYIDSETDEYNDLIISLWMKRNSGDTRGVARGIVTNADIHFGYSWNNFNSLRLDASRKTPIFEQVGLGRVISYNHYLIHFKENTIMEFYFNKKLVKTVDLSNYGRTFDFYAFSHFIFGNNRFDPRSYLDGYINNLIIMKGTLTNDLMDELYNKKIKGKMITDEIVYSKLKGDENE